MNVGGHEQGVSEVEPAESVQIQLHYGRGQMLDCDVARRRLLCWNQPPVADPDFRERLREQFRQPLECPPLQQFAVETDRVVLVVDPGTPAAAAIVAEIWQELEPRGLDPARMLILQPPGGSAAAIDPRSELPEAVRGQVAWRIHDPSDQNSCGYLASTSTGERIYLASDLITADLVILVGVSGFDPLLGYRGTTSVLYPGLSNAEAQRRMAGQGHSELAPDNDRPLRQIVDEIGWLLGVMITVQVVPSIGGGVAETFVGSVERVAREIRRAHSRAWKLSVPERAELVVVAIEADSTGHGWQQLGAALETARSVVCNEGRIVVLSEIGGPIGHGLEIVRQCLEPADAIKPLRLEMPPDVLVATELARATDWASLYLLSQLEADLVEDLFAIPLASVDEVRRLLDRDEPCVIIQSAHNVYAELPA